LPAIGGQQRHVEDEARPRVHQRVVVRVRLEVGGTAGFLVPPGKLAAVSTDGAAARPVARGDGG
jgi:hypothetical protein